MLDAGTLGVSCEAHLDKYREISEKLTKAVTSVKFSPTNNFALLGFGVRSKEGEVEEHSVSKITCEIIRTTSTLPTIVTFTDEVDEVNNCSFNPIPGQGIVYGTKRGAIKMLLKKI